MKPIREGFKFFLIAVCSSLALPQQVRGDVEALLSEINRRPSEERIKALTEGARKEGVAYYFGSSGSSDIGELLKGFSKNYPFVDVRYTRLGGPSAVSKITTEHRAGVFNVDVISVRGTLFPELISSKVVAKYKSPMVPFLRKGYFDAEGYLSGYYATGYTMVYNTTNVKPGEVPRSFEDLLNPRWKGRLVMDKEEYDWLAGMIDVMGENKATAFFKRLVVEQGLQFKRGHALITQLVAAGEHDLLIDGYVHSAAQFKMKGAPINFVFMNPTVVKPPSSIGIASRAPHPYAAALLADYHLSKEAQEILAQKQFYWTSRRDVKWATEPGTELHVVSPLEWGGGKYNYVSELFRKIVGG
ncbi:MAG TPA: extracellular solute-binding protein [Candidatus Binatia bacterium]